MDHCEPSGLKQPRSSLSHAAPWFTVLPLPIVSVEHPFIVNDLSKAVQTLGGPNKVEELVEFEDRNLQASLYLRPEDRMSKAIYSKNVATQNVLLRITIPKRTGRKRKRGTHDPFENAENELDTTAREANIPTNLNSSSKYRDTRTLLQMMQDNVGKYDVQVVGPIEQTHRFRTLPDFVYSTSNSTFMKKIRKHILPFDYEKMKGFELNLSRGPRINTEIMPPPSFTHFSLPFNYSYKQNPATKQILDSSGKLITINTQPARKILTQLVTFDIETVPSQPPSDAPPLSSLEGSLKLLVELVQRHLDERPIWTRRALSNQIHHPEWNSLNKHVYQYVGYMFRSGPWRETVVKFGVDPRSDQCYRVYQTLIFQFDATGSSYRRPKKANMQRRPRGGTRKSRKTCDEKSHLFDGVKLTMDGKVWQVCDIIDPMLKSLLATTNLRTRCEINKDGWYHNGTWAKARIIMKAKMSYIAAGKGVPPASNYAQLAAIPDILDSNTRRSAVFTKRHATAQECELASLIRTVAGPPEMTGHGIDLSNDVTRQSTQVTDESPIEDVESSRVVISDDFIDHRLNEPIQEFESLEQEAQGHDLIGVLDYDTEGNEFASSGEDEMEDVEDDEGDEED